MTSFTDFLIDLASTGAVAVGESGAVVLLGSGSRPALVAGSPSAAAPVSFAGTGRGGSLSRSVCAECSTESLATSPELLNHRCGE